MKNLTEAILELAAAMRGNTEALERSNEIALDEGADLETQTLMDE